MEYDAQVFKMKANKKARNVWMALSLILSLSYTSDTAKGLHTLPYLCNVYGGLLDPVFVWSSGTPSAGSSNAGIINLLLRSGMVCFMHLLSVRVNRYCRLCIYFL